jgi:hypothetical protein
MAGGPEQAAESQTIERSDSMKILGVEVPQTEAAKGPVLDIPAIDMTGEAGGAASSSAPEAPPAAARVKAKAPARRRRGAAGKNVGELGGRAGSAPKGTSAISSNRRRGGSVAQETYQAVEAVLKDGGSKKEAFARVAEESGRNANSVSTIYYRAAAGEAAIKSDSSAPTKSPARSARVGSPVPRRRRHPRSTAYRERPVDSQMGQWADEVVRSVNELASAFKAQSEEISDLRLRLEGVRELLR